MFQNYLIVALRNITRHRLYSVINIAGLAVGLACAILILLFVRDELSYNKWVSGYENLYRGEVTFYPPGRDPLRAAASMGPMAEAFKAEVPGVVAATRISGQTSAVRFGDKQFFEDVTPADSNFFQVVKLPLLGDPATVLSRPDTAVISESLARKYFGNTDPIGQILTLDENLPVEITGIMADLPHNTTFELNFILPLGSKADRVVGTDPANNNGVDSWTSVNFFTFFEMAPGTDMAAARAQLPAVVRNHVSPSILGLPADFDTAELLKLHLMPFGDLHLSTPGLSLGQEKTPGDWETVFGFAAIAALILLIACINFMNLATARATQRAREVSLRKVVGARRTQLIAQFLGESILISLFALAVALALVELMLPAYARFLDRPIELHYLADWDVTLGALGMAVLAGLLGGAYPALILSGFRPAIVLKANRSSQSGSGLLRTTLVIVQFAISIGLGITTAVVYGQTLYAQNYDVGFNRQNVLIMTGVGRNQAKPVAETLRNELLAYPGVLGVTASNSKPFENDENNTIWRTPEDPTQPILIRTQNVEPNFFEVYNIRLVAGRFLSRDRGEDVINITDFNEFLPENTSVIINEAAVRRLGFASAEDAIGKPIREDTGPGSDEGSPSVTRIIVGVVADTHFDSLRSPVQPTRFDYNPNFMNYFVIPVRAENVPATMEFVRSTWSRLVPDLPARVAFLDEAYNALYAQDKQRSQMFAFFSALAIFIACLGLFGLASFTAERRTKEIGIRKVFGARVRDVVRLLVWQFSKPVLIANLIAWPVAWYYLHNWLNGFVYRIDLNPLYFAAAGLVALLIAWATVTAHSVRVARSKPIVALRYE